jgi:hypothetical protein
MARNETDDGGDMTIGFRGSGVPVAMTFGGLLMSAQLVTAPPAQACLEGQLQDTVTGMCWSQSGQGESYGGPGDGPCLPGRLGSCVGSLQKGGAIYINVPGGVTTW